MFNTLVFICTLSLTCPMTFFKSDLLILSLLICERVTVTLLWSCSRDSGPPSEVTHIKAEWQWWAMPVVRTYRAPAIPLRHGRALAWPLQVAAGSGLAVFATLWVCLLSRPQSLARNNHCYSWKPCQGRGPTSLGWWDSWVGLISGFSQIPENQKCMISCLIYQNTDFFFQAGKPRKR